MASGFDTGIGGAPALRVDAVAAVHGRGARVRQVLASTSLTVERGRSLAVTGRSGAGKSTLADIVLALRRPAAGEVAVCGEHWCSPRTVPRRRRRYLVQGVPQDPAASFVPGWTLRTSIEHAIRRLAGPRRALGAAGDRSPGGAGDGNAVIDGDGAGGLSGAREGRAASSDSLRGRGDTAAWQEEIGTRIDRAAELVRLDPALLDRRPAEVSGGQAQRAAIARALAVQPTVLVADEPTSALDPETSWEVQTALLTAAARTGAALLLVTHDLAFAARCDATVRLTAPDP